MPKYRKLFENNPPRKAPQCETMIRVKEVTPERHKFPSLTDVVSQFVSQNKLTTPLAQTPTEFRGLLVYWKNGDHVNVYETSQDSSVRNNQFYVLQGRVRGEQVNLYGSISIPIYRDKTEKKEICRGDENTNYKFLGRKTSPKREPLFN